MTSEAEKRQELEKKFWDELEDSPFVMLGLQGVDDDFTRPMTAQVDNGRIYFFAARSEDLFKGLGRTSRAVATFSSKGHKLFASIHGRLELDDDRAVIDRLWNPVVASWYRDGRDDPDLALLRFDAESADVWEAQPGSVLKAVIIKMLGRDPGKQQQDEHRAEISL